MQPEDLKEQNKLEQQFNNAYQYNKDINNIVAESKKEILNILEEAKENIDNLFCKFIIENKQIIPYDSTIQKWYSENSKNLQDIIKLMDNIRKVDINGSK